MVAPSPEYSISQHQTREKQLPAALSQLWWVISRIILLCVQGWWLAIASCFLESSRIFTIRINTGVIIPGIQSGPGHRLSSAHCWPLVPGSGLTSAGHWLLTSVMNGACLRPARDAERRRKTHKYFPWWYFCTDGIKSGCWLSVAMIFTDLTLSGYLA